MIIFVGLQLLGHVAASPQLRLHTTPSPHMSAHSATGSPSHHGLLTIDRPISRESYSMTPPRAQVFPVSLRSTTAVAIYASLPALMLNDYACHFLSIREHTYVRLQCIFLLSQVCSLRSPGGAQSHASIYYKSSRTKYS